MKYMPIVQKLHADLTIHERDIQNVVSYPPDEFLEWVLKHKHLSECIQYFEQLEQFEKT